MLKSRFKTMLVVAAILVQGMLFVPRIVFASDYQLSNFAGIAGYDTADQSKSTLTGLSQTVISVFLSLLGIIFLGFSLYAGIRWMTAQGNEEEVTKAKDTLQAAIIGMVIIAMSYAITSLVFGLLNNAPVPASINTTAPSNSGGPSCTSDANCKGGLVCDNSVCAQCSDPAKHCGLNCSAKCSMGGSCFIDSDCILGNCDATKHCSKTNGKSPGDICSNSSECMSNYCYPAGYLLAGKCQ